MHRRDLLIAAVAVCGARRAEAQTELQSPIGQSPIGQSPIGLWRTIDDHTGRERGTVRIFEANGLLYGRIEHANDPKVAGHICDLCTDDRRGKPIIGLDIIRGLRPDGDVWDGGEILDPENGKTYRASIRLEDGGRKLIVRGSILGGLIGRSQTWLRVAPN